ncbi:phenazine biosynthesis-like domain-containing protein isoform X2 [Anolis carolinensis]|uniref:phenazine biosynthesis-like domain-containing protein isoform X2 n=1 Tax=Anolis carolinensis TaxID=28377 RepID=UPI000462757E|nr:PREDICTED: phenazine biosynthesis-like domain-containing protein isoform X2 [Anolis carolinensis]|eukprot:XP_008113391.1 PREDICTED: phenazine biosynthesis-like domain-containing protein isoform X2 [Anolis carolinensis]
MEISIFTVDAFTEQPFHGNPAAVCLLEDKLEENQHQKIANEMNLSETAFIRKLNPTDDFTKKNVNSTLTFITLSGELIARQAEDHIILDLPLYFTHPQDVKEVEELVKAAVGDKSVQDVRYSPDTKKLLIRLSDAYERADLEKLKVNAENLLLAEKTGRIKGVIITLKGDGRGKQESYDFYSRYFAPWYGVSEDPVTGAAHTVLSSYWSQQLGKKKMCAFQCSARGGRLKISLRQDGRVDLGGQSSIVLKGFLSI